MISKSLAKEILNIALSTGGDFAEIYLEDSSSSNISLENSKVDTMSKVSSLGVGIRILNKFKSVYGHTNDVSKKSLLKLASDLAASYNEERIITVENFKTKHIKSNCTIEIPFETVKEEDIISLLRKGSNIMSEVDKCIVRTIAGFSYTLKRVEIFNSDSKHIIDNRSIGRLSLGCMASRDGKLESNFYGPGTRRGFEHFLNSIDVLAKAKQTAQICIKMLDAKEAPSGVMPVVIGNGWGGVLFHEACGHPLEASAVSKGLSCFKKENIGTKVASEVVSAYDDGTISNAWGSSNVDDEGNAPHKTCLIKNGVLQDFLVDKLTGRRLEHEANGSCRRQNYSFEPTTRMSNTYIGAGKSTKDEIIKNTKLGLYAVSFNGGSVDPTTGEFNFGCSEAYIIRNGEICEPVRGATLIGKGHEILHQIDMVADDLDFGQGMCGASSGSIPTNVGQPTLRIKNITVGGNGGKLK